MLTKEVEKQLIAKAFEMKPKSYCPYSNYQSGAAALFESGKIYGGYYIENSSYGASNCSERTAIYKAVSEGERKLVAIAICGGKPGEQKENVFPCGVCLQIMREFCSPNDLKIYICSSEEKFKVYTLEELLPHSFGPEFLLN